MTERPQSPAAPAAEFDHYAAQYDAGMDNPVKALMGSSDEAFVAVKRNWLLRRLPALRDAARPPSILDYGCGAATLLRLLAASLPQATLRGCDISTGMLDEARRRWPQGATPAEFLLQQGALTPLPDACCDLIVISAVLHHVPVAERPAVHAELRRLLRPGGHVVVFEHNPANPVTRYVVARTPIDRNAILLPVAEVESALAQAGFGDIRTGYLMFAPPRLDPWQALDRVFGWLPLGAQYATIARG